MSAPTALSCPRCGYDLSGLAAAHGPVDRLPAQGTCSECGLGFEWPDVVDPMRKLLPGFIEHARGGLVVAAWRTWWIALRPGVFWTRVRLEMRPRVWRMAVWLILVIGVFMVPGSVVPAGVSAAWRWAVGPPPWNAPLGIISAGSFGLVQEQWSGAPAGNCLSFVAPPASIAGPLAAWLTMLITFIGLPHTRQVSKVRMAHVARAGTYSLAWFAAIMSSAALVIVTSSLAWLQAHWTAPRASWWSARPPAALQHTLEWLAAAPRHYWVPLFLLFMVWLMRWWWCALQDGFRIAEYRKVWWTLTVTGWTAAIAAVLASTEGAHLFV
jgi:hypothetical protein